MYVINNPLILPVGWELTQQPQLLDGKSSLTTEEFLSTMTGNQAEAFGSCRAQQSQHNPWTNDISGAVLSRRNDLLDCCDCQHQ